MHDTGSTQKSGGDNNRNKFGGVVAISLEQCRKLATRNHGVVVHKRSFSVIQLVAKAVNVENFETRAVLHIVDHTGGEPMLVNLWNLEEPLGIQPGQYCRVFANLRIGDEGQTMVGFKAEPIKSINDITHHLIECALANAVLAKRKENIANNLTYSCENFPGSLVNTGDGANILPKPTAINQGPASGGDYMAMPASGMAGLSAQQSAVLAQISKSTDDVGVSLTELSTNLKNLNLKQIKEIVDFLSSEGHIYTTLDENHFKSTDS